jgi:putative peptidoglycan lipid II flippase
VIKVLGVTAIAVDEATEGRMTTYRSTPKPGEEEPAIRKVMLGGFAALAEAAWMGSVQASDVLEPLHIRQAIQRRWRVVVPRLPKLHLASLFTRELTIAEASFVLMASFFTSALLGAVRQILFNAQFGTSQEANAYYAAFRLPDTLFSLIAGGALSSAMIPVLLSTNSKDGIAAGKQLIRLVLTTVLLFFAGLILVIELFTPAFVNNILAPGFDDETRALTVTLTRIMLLQPLILVLASVATAVLNQRNQFLLTGLSILSLNIALLLGIGVARWLPGLGIYGPTLGVIGGAVLQVLILWPGLADLGRWFAWQPAHRRLQEVLALLIPNGLAVSVNYAGFILDTAFASQVAEPAALPALYNAWLLVGLPIALLGQAVGQAAFPRLAAHAESEQWLSLRRTLLQALGAVMVLAVLALLLLFFMGRMTIRVLFERGQFDAAAGGLTYQVLLAYAIALPAYVGTEVLTRGLIALRDTRTPLLTNTVQLAGRALLIVLWLPRLGVVAVPAALAVTATGELLIQGIVLLMRLRSRIAGVLRFGKKAARGG